MKQPVGEGRPMTEAEFQETLREAEGFEPLTEATVEAADPNDVVGRCKQTIASLRREVVEKDEVINTLTKMLEERGVDASEIV